VLFFWVEDENDFGSAADDSRKETEAALFDPVTTVIITTTRQIVALTRQLETSFAPWCVEKGRFESYLNR
jgi:hypothetical protein